jgi:hypothetical protein
MTAVVAWNWGSHLSREIMKKTTTTDVAGNRGRGEVRRWEPTMRGWRETCG